MFADRENATEFAGHLCSRDAVQVLILLTYLVWYPRNQCLSIEQIPFTEVRLNLLPGTFSRAFGCYNRKGYATQ